MILFRIPHATTYLNWLSNYASFTLRYHELSLLCRISWASRHCDLGLTFRIFSLINETSFLFYLDSSTDFSSTKTDSQDMTSQQENIAWSASTSDKNSQESLLSSGNDISSAGGARHVEESGRPTGNQGMDNWGSSFGDGDDKESGCAGPMCPGNSGKYINCLFFISFKFITTQHTSVPPVYVIHNTNISKIVLP